MRNLPGSNSACGEALGLTWISVWNTVNICTGSLWGILWGSTHLCVCNALPFWASLGLSGLQPAASQLPSQPATQAQDSFPGRNSASQPASQFPGRNSACG